VRVVKRTGFNIGLPLIECADISKEVAPGEDLEVNFDMGVIHIKDRQIELSFKPIPTFMQEMLEKGGLMPYLDACGGYTD
jgi:3-isopropylmalate/(R)-2-methylmalate dehydratase small subunit